MRTRNAMIVDDDQTMMLITERLLTSFPVVGDVKLAYNGSEALGLLTRACENDREPPDVILLDLHMPVMDGFQFVDTLATIKCLKDLRKPVLIMASSSPDPRDEVKAKSMGIRHYYPKPISLENIQEVFETEFF